MTRNSKSFPISVARPRDPDNCFVLFSSVHLTALSATVSLQSLLHQVQQQRAARRIVSISYDSQTYRMDIQFEPDSQNN